MISSDLVEGHDGLVRCAWGATPEIYRDYHDHEWGRPVTDEKGVFERICLEGFQAGLSWLTILRKRQAFREAFSDFDPEIVARFGPDDIDRLLGNADIIRHRGKIAATVNNARSVLSLHSRGGSLSDIVWAAAPDDPVVPESFADVPAITAESTALSKRLKELGFAFVGPTTMYAAMQAIGVVDDHLVGCHRRSDTAAEGESPIGGS